MENKNILIQGKSEELQKYLFYKRNYIDLDLDLGFNGTCRHYFMTLRGMTYLTIPEIKLFKLPVSNRFDFAKIKFEDHIELVIVPYESWIFGEDIFINGLIEDKISGFKESPFTKRKKIQFLGHYFKIRIIIKNRIVTDVIYVVPITLEANRKCYDQELFSDKSTSDESIKYIKFSEICRNKSIIPNCI